MEEIALIVRILSFQFVISELESSIEIHPLMFVDGDDFARSSMEFLLVDNRIALVLEFSAS